MKKTSVIIAAALLAVGCNESAKKEEPQSVQTENTPMDLTEKENQWQELFNGESLDGWKVYNSDKEPTRWSVQDSALFFNPSQGQGTENLISEQEFGSFELSLEWKISEGGNSGIMWAVQEVDSLGEPYLSGPEIQVLDNERHPDAQNGPIRQAGALYDMVEPSADVTRPAGEWNEMTLSINYEENHGSVQMNGTEIVEFPLFGEEWDQLKENSKFADWPVFGVSRTGHIALQDHGDQVWYRNIKILNSSE